MMRRLFATALLAAAAGAHAQGAASAPAAAASATPLTPAKKALIQRVLTAQQASLDNIARDVAERPAMQLTGSARQYIAAQVPEAKRQATWEQVQAATRKYIDEAVPLVKARAQALSQTTLTATLNERFTEDELRQVASTLELPAFRKFQQAMPEISDRFVQALIADAGPGVDPKLQALNQAITKALGILPPAGAASAPATPKAAASKPGK